MTTSGPTSAPDDLAAARIAALEARLAQTTQRLQEVYSTASELLAVDDLDELLSRLTRRAALAAHARQYLLVVRTRVDGPEHLHHHGFEPAEAEALAAELWRPTPDDAGGSRLVVDVASSRQSYGRLAAVYPTGTRFDERERELFALYANYAATALDLVTSLDVARRSDATARALLDFSRALSAISTTAEVVQTLADTVPAVVGCDRSTVLLWDAETERLVFRAASGEGALAALAALAGVLAPDQADPETGPAGPGSLAGLEGLAIASADTPLVADLLSSRQVRVLARTSPDPFVQALLAMIDAGVTLLAPLYSAEEFLGVVAADYREPVTRDVGTDPEVHQRLTGLADQTVTALLNARLLEQVGHLAWHDPLTGLPNRRLLQDRVDQELERARRVDENSSLFFLDLDRFKHVNDTLGHRVGDELLRQVAGRLTGAVRRQDTVARLGGDEFAILLPGVDEPGVVAQLAERLVGILHEPYTVTDQVVHTSASLGIAVSPEHGQTYDELVNHADEAMYRAKALGRDTWQVYSPAVAAGAPPDVTEDLRRAVGGHELFVLYQPYIDLETDEIAGVEALVRWRHPERGVIEPAMFLPEAEASGLIVAVDAWVLDEACRQMAEWRSAGVMPPRLSVNVSARDLLDPGFVATVTQALTDHGLAPESLELEIAERIAPDSDGLMLATVEALRATGVRFSIDDFSTTTSALGQVAAFPVTTLKIDRSFVHILGPDDELNALVSAIVAMTQRLGLQCIAEGVETSGQSRVLLQRGVTTAQGYFFSPPLFPADVEAMMRGADPRADRLEAAPTPAGPVSAIPLPHDDQG